MPRNPEEDQKRLRSAIDQLMGGEIPEGLKVDLKSVCAISGVPRATLYRNYPHIRDEFERRLDRTREKSGEPDPRIAQIDRLKEEATGLRERIADLKTQKADLEAFKAAALSRLAAQHDEITRLREAQERSRSSDLRLVTGQRDGDR